MREPDDTGATYVLETREGAPSAVETTLDKYYGDMIRDVSSHHESESVVRFSTSHELPLDAFRRITGVRRATHILHHERDPELTSIEAGCRTGLSEAPQGGAVSVSVRSWGEEGPSDQAIERRCRSTIEASGRRVVDDDNAASQLRVLVVEAWVAIGSASTE